MAGNSNVVRLDEHVGRRGACRDDAGAVVAGVAKQVDKLQDHSKKLMQETILSLGNSNARARSVIDRLADTGRRDDLRAKSDRIAELIDLAGRKLADL